MLQAGDYRILRKVIKFISKFVLHMKKSATQMLTTRYFSPTHQSFVPSIVRIRPPSSYCSSHTFRLRSHDLPPDGTLS